MELKKFEDSSIRRYEFNNAYFYERLYWSLVEDGIPISYGDFCSRVLKNGTIKVMKALGIYETKGARKNKMVYIHEKLEVIINSTISSPDIIAKTIIDLVNGKFNSIKKFQDVNLESFMSLDDDYPYSVIPSKCTYIFYNKHNGLHKIGRSSNVFNRLNSLRNEINPDLEIVAYLGMDIEGLLHKEYVKQRKHGEWFLLSDDDILDIKNKYGFTIIQLFQCNQKP